LVTSRFRACPAKLGHFSQRFGQLYAADFASPTGMNLRLNHPTVTAQFFGNLLGAFRRGRCFPSGTGME